jgi:hypothetical protein
MPRTLTLFALFALSSAGCATRVVYREDPPPTVSFAAGPGCSPDSPCVNTYYWDEWREVYVFYDGYRYIDCTGLPGGYPIPPYGFAYGAPPRGYVPPSAWVPAPGAYRPPLGYVRGRAPRPSPVVVQPPPPARGGSYGFNGPPPNAGGVYVSPPPPAGGSGYVAPPPSHGYVAPAAGYAYTEEPGGWARPTAPGGFPQEPVRTSEPASQGLQTGTHAEPSRADEQTGSRAEPARTWQAQPPPGRGFESSPGGYRAEPGRTYEPPVQRAESPTLPGAERLPPPGATLAQPANRKPPPPPEPVRIAPVMVPQGAPMHRTAH